jgi:hypothetical protein
MLLLVIFLITKQETYMTHSISFIRLNIFEKISSRMFFLIASFFKSAYKKCGDFKIMEKNVLSYSIGLKAGLMISLLSYINITSYLTWSFMTQFCKFWVGGRNV